MRSDLFANVEQQASEPGFRLQNGKLLKATINGGSFFARRGSMVAYQGAARFEYQGALSGDGSMKDKLLKAAKGAISGEGVPLMKVSGQAEVFLAEQAAQRIDGGSNEGGRRPIRDASADIDDEIPQE